MPVLVSSFESRVRTFRPDEAIKLYQEALGIQQSMLGPDHPDTLNSLNNLGNACPHRADPLADSLQMRRADLHFRQFAEIVASLAKRSCFVGLTRGFFQDRRAIAFHAQRHFTVERIKMTRHFRQRQRSRRTAISAARVLTVLSGKTTSCSAARVPG